MSADDSDSFYASVPVFRSFHRLMEPTLYAPLPNDWMLGIADVVESTKAIRENRYKAVNMAGAAVIAAVKNALGGRDFPYVFGGDGASFAVPPRYLVRARDALAAVAAWVKDELDLTMRIALVPVAHVHSQGLDVRVTRFAPSSNVSYAIFSGGGLAWADAAMKRGELAVAPAPPGTPARCYLADSSQKRLNTAYVLKESFGQLWSYEREGWARRFFENWRASLKWQRLTPYEKFAAMIDRHWDGIAAYCRPENKVSLGFVEGLNNKIRVIQRRAYGLRNEDYLRLKILTCMLPAL
jgi:hypothetical protein